jgi:hypothetical protein
MNILNANPFEMSENPFDEKDNYSIQVSDDASVSNFHLPISCIIGFRLTNKKNLANQAGKQIKIYCDNGGSFYPYKVKPEFANNQYIMNIAHHYQITNDLSDKMFGMNCLTYALMMSCKFENTVIDNFKIDLFWQTVVCYLEQLRIKYFETKDKRYWKELIRLLPESWLQKRTITMNYENIFNMVHQRKNHKLTEWSESFIGWAKTLPYAEELLFINIKPKVDFMSYEDGIYKCKYESGEEFESSDGINWIQIL